MIKNDFEVITKKIKTSKDVHLHVVGDLHAGAVEADLKGWEYFNQTILNDPQAYVIFLGDLMNNATKSSVSNCFEEVMRPRDQKIYLKEKLKPLAESGKILAILPGNHENRSLKDADDNPLYDVAAKLDLEDIYRDNLAIVHFSIGVTKNANNYVVLVTHGDGGGALTGGGVNRYERYSASWDGVDVFCYGHTHKPFATKPNKMIYDRYKKIAYQRNTIVMAVPSWMRYGGYPIRKTMTPTHKADPDQPMFLTLSGKSHAWKAKLEW